MHIGLEKPTPSPHSCFTIFVCQSTSISKYLHMFMKQKMSYTLLYKHKVFFSQPQYAYGFSNYACNMVQIVGST